MNRPFLYLTSLTIVLCCVLASVRGLAQGNTVITYGIRQGMNSANIGSILRDSKGRIWVSGYGYGISMYDGSKWQSYSMSKGLASYASGTLHEDSEGNIWVGHSSASCISKITSNGIKAYFFPDKHDFYLSLIGRKTPACLIRYGDEWITAVYDSSKDKFVLTKEKITLKNATCLYNRIKQEFYISDSKSTYKVNAGNIQKLDKKLQLDKDISQIKYFDSPELYFTEENGNLLRHTPGKKQVLNPKSLTTNYGPPQKIKSRLQSINFDYEYDRYYIIWATDEKNNYLLQEYAISDNRLVSSINYRSYFIPKVCIKDAAGNYWVGTESNVQKILAYQYIIPVTADKYMNETWAITQATNGNLWMSSYGRGLRIFDGHKLKKPQTGFSYFDEAYFDDTSIRCEDGSMLFNLERNPKSKKDSPQAGILRIKGQSWEFIPSERPAMFFGRDNKGRLMRGTFDTGLFVYNNESDLTAKNLYLKIDTTKGLMPGNVVSAIQDKYGHYWMGMGSRGLSMYNQEKNKSINWSARDNATHPRVMSIQEDNHGNLWLGCHEGLWFLKNNKDIEPDFSLKNHCLKVGTEYLGESAVYITKMMDDSTLLVGNALGYFLIDLKEFYNSNNERCTFNGIFKENYSNYIGGAVNQNGAFRSSDGCFWLLTDNGLVRHDPSKYVSSGSGRMVTIDSIRAGGHIYTREYNQIDLGYRSSNLSFYYSATPDSLLYDNLFYQYRLNNSAWSALSRDGHADFSDLQSGRYTFSVRTVVDGKNSDTKTVSFRIFPPWWLKWQVWLAVLLLILAVGLFLYQKQTKIYNQQLMLSQKETEVEIMSKEKDMLRVQAIVNQLNPHFINNALQWLQVRVDDDPEAVRVIGRLAENISTVFRNSRKKISFHTLENELLLASNYLYIQSVRFGERLKVKVADLTDLQGLKDVMVPIMIIQIHAENAIEHGIRNNDDGSGTVSIRVKDAGEYVEIDIEDDGVGREAASRMGSRGTQNGTTMLSELERIYNKKNKMKITQTYIDNIFQRGDGRGFGTRVEIRVPKEYEFVI